MKISQETIIDVSLKILNESGIDGLTMRELASRLNIKAASLYWHIKNKNQLLELIAEDICQSLPLDMSNDNPREEIVLILSAYRVNLLKVRDAVEILRLTHPVTPARIALIKTVFDKLHSIGVKKERLIQTANLLNNYVLSFVADEIQFKYAFDAGMENFFGYPYDNDFDTQFKYGLDIIINGIESMKEH